MRTNTREPVQPMPTPPPSEPGIVTVRPSGDFIYIPADRPHQPINPSETDPAVAVEARNVADDRSSVELYELDS
jgi:uncharacterized RmlC-like cupin family protein